MVRRELSRTAAKASGMSSSRTCTSALRNSLSASSTRLFISSRSSVSAARACFCTSSKALRNGSVASRTRFLNCSVFSSRSASPSFWYSASSSLISITYGRMRLTSLSFFVPTIFLIRFNITEVLLPNVLNLCSASYIKIHDCYRSLQPALNHSMAASLAFDTHSRFHFFTQKAAADLNESFGSIGDKETVNGVTFFPGEHAIFKLRLDFLRRLFGGIYQPHTTSHEFPNYFLNQWIVCATEN